MSKRSCPNLGNGDGPAPGPANVQLVSKMEQEDAFQINWTLEDFSSIVHDAGQEFKSEVFCGGPKLKWSWQLQISKYENPSVRVLVVNGKASSKRTQSVAIHLIITSLLDGFEDTRSDLECRCNISFLNAVDGTTLGEHATNNHIGINNRICIWKFDSKEIQELLINDIMKMKFEVGIFKGVNKGVVYLS
ncbi:unnamed protein product [Orchesella dallaii]|uniref:MATH domain-containing protein n=1 Tax=Orchesella dallaii TaxID=48710 RepID=A0ABP1S6D3_9HEXA